MHYYLLTGASRGLGAALAQRLAQVDHMVFAWARSTEPEWVGSTSATNLEYQSVDLAQPARVTEALQVVWEAMERTAPTSFTLIHNAGLLSPIGQIGQPMQDASLVQSLQVNLLAPILLTQQVVQKLRDLPIPKRILGISSGAGRKPYRGWGAYCTSKAGLDMYLRVLAVEQQDRAHPFRAVSLAPGVIDTGMQAHIRAQEAETFPDVARFHDLKESGALWSPDYAAERIDAFLHHPSFGANSLEDIRTWRAS